MYVTYTCYIYSKHCLFPIPNSINLFSKSWFNLLFVCFSFHSLAFSKIFDIRYCLFSSENCPTKGLFLFFFPLKYKQERYNNNCDYIFIIKLILRRCLTDCRLFHWTDVWNKMPIAEVGEKVLFLAIS